MNKKVVLLMCGWLLLSILPIPTVTAGTVEDTPTTESTLPSMSDDLLSEKQNTPTTPSIEEEPEMDSEPIEESLVNEEPQSESTEGGKEIRPFGGGGIGPQTMNLIEGRPGDATPYDIDADFADALRATVPGWSTKPVNGITDDDMANLLSIEVGNRNLVDLKGIEYAKNIKSLACNHNKLSTLDISEHKYLETLICASNNFLSLDLSKNDKLVHVDVRMLNKMISLTINGADSLEYLACSNTSKLNNLDVSQCKNLKELYINSSGINSLLVAGADELRILECSNNSNLTFLNINTNQKLESLNCRNSRILSLDASQVTSLKEIDCRSNQMITFIPATNGMLEIVRCGSNKLSSLVLGGSNLDAVLCELNDLTFLDVSQATNLKSLNCNSNRLTTILINQSIMTLSCANNSINDLTFLQGCHQLTYLDASGQKFNLPIPIVEDSKATIDLLKTSAEDGIFVSSTTITPPPASYSYVQDKIEMHGVSVAALENSTVYFEYDGSKLTEGSNASGTTKLFGGEIFFYPVSHLENEIKPNIERVRSGEVVSWSWTIFTSVVTKLPIDIYPSLNLPTGATLVTGSVKIDNNPVNDNVLDGLTSIGTLDNFQDRIVITFDTTISGSVEEWLDIEVKTKWTDDTMNSPYLAGNKGKIQIQDDEQTYTPDDYNALAILSVPIDFDYGIKQDISTTAKSYQLNSQNYLTNTKVVTTGFYTRIKDDRTTGNGWKLTAALSEFEDKKNNPMPFGSGASLSFNGMSIESVTDRDTEQEQIDPSPTVGVPGLVETNKTIVAGQTAQTLISADASGTQGKGTWQLRMPFDQISLNLPANAGKTSNVYNAKLTWSLDSTP